MVEIIQTNDITLYKCEECGLKYANMEIAEKCQVWCREHRSCNLDLIKDAVQGAENGLSQKLL